MCQRFDSAPPGASNRNRSILEYVRFGFSFHFQLGRTARLWVASIVFTAIGVLMFLLPRWINQEQSGADAEEAQWVFGFLGVVFAGLGLPILGLMIAGRVTGRGVGANQDHWEAHVELLGGLLGALAFAVPATFVLPGMWLLSQMRPDLFSPAEFKENFLLGLLFSVLGAVSLAGLWFLLIPRRRRRRR